MAIGSQMVVCTDWQSPLAEAIAECRMEDAKRLILKGAYVEHVPLEIVQRPSAYQDSQYWDLISLHSCIARSIHANAGGEHSSVGRRKSEVDLSTEVDSLLCMIGWLRAHDVIPMADDLTEMLGKHWVGTGRPRRINAPVEIILTAIGNLVSSGCALQNDDEWARGTDWRELLENVDVYGATVDDCAKMVRSEWGFSPLHHACLQQAPLPILDALLDHRADINITSTFGVTPLMVAAYAGATEHINHLIDRGADLRAKSVSGHTAEQFSKRRDTSELIAIRKKFPRGLLVKGASHDDGLYPDGLRHRAINGVLVRSKSEIIIANTLYHLSLPFEYEATVLDRRSGERVRPDFKVWINEPSRFVLWEHLGMESQEYRQAWSKKLMFYGSNGFVVGERLFVTDERNGDLDSLEVQETALRIKLKLEDPTW